MEVEVEVEVRVGVRVEGVQFLLGFKKGACVWCGWFVWF